MSLWSSCARRMKLSRIRKFRKIYAVYAVYAADENINSNSVF